MNLTHDPKPTGPPNEESREGDTSSTKGNTTSHLVKLSYFKEGGKWYGGGEYTSNEEHLFGIFNEVKNMRDLRTLPGLIKEHGYYFVLIDVPSHPHNHPRLITH